jgi:hypothetical protein
VLRDVCLFDIGTGRSNADAITARFVLQQCVDLWVLVAVVVLFSIARDGRFSQTYRSDVIQVPSASDFERVLGFYAISFVIELVFTVCILAIRAYSFGASTRQAVWNGLAAFTEVSTSTFAAFAAATMLIMLAVRSEEV